MGHQKSRAAFAVRLFCRPISRPNPIRLVRNGGTYPPGRLGPARLRASRHLRWDIVNYFSRAAFAVRLFCRPISRPNPIRLVRNGGTYPPGRVGPARLRASRHLRWVIINSILAVPHSRCGFFVAPSPDRTRSALRGTENALAHFFYPLRWVAGRTRRRRKKHCPAQCFFDLLYESASNAPRSSAYK